MSSIADPLVAGIALLIILVFFVLGFFIFNSLAGSGLISTTYANTGYNFYAILDYAGVFFIVTMSLAVVIAAYMTPTNPIFAVVGLVFLFIQAIVMPALVNVINSVLQSGSLLAATNAGMPHFAQLIQIMPILTIVFGFLALVVGTFRTGGSF